MRTIWEIAINDLRQIFRERGIWINLVVIPLILSYFIGFANNAAMGAGGDGPRLRIDVIDRDGGALSQQYLEAVRAANTSFVLCPQDNTDGDFCALEGALLDEGLAETRLREQTSLALLILPAGFGDALASGSSTQVIYRSNEDASAPSYILQAVQSATQRVGAALVASRVGNSVLERANGLPINDALRAEMVADIQTRAGELLAEQPALVSVTTRDADENAPVVNGFSQSVPGMATMYVMFAVFPAAVALMVERKQWTLQRLVTMPVSRAQILGGKLLARFFIGMIQYGIVFAFGLVLGVRYGNDPLGIILTMIVYVLCITALTLALTTLLRNENQANAITLLLTITLAPLGGAWWPLEIVPDWMRTVGHISPVAWAMDSYNALIVHGGGLVDVLPYLGVLTAMTVGFFLFGVARFRYE